LHSVAGKHLKVGILSLQGDFIEHEAMLRKLDVDVIEVRLPQHLQAIDGLIIPGGESTTIGKLMVDFGLLEPLREFAKGKAVWGTCAGAILLSKDIHRKQPLLELMDITIERNAFGRQVDSFTIDLEIPCLAKVAGDHRPFHTVFIRAPLIESVGENVEVLAKLPDNRIVAAQQGHWLATSFHPELTADDRFHKYFLELVT
jgi:5'-phosphate synthase pdxT subunit